MRSCIGLCTSNCFPARKRTASKIAFSAQLSRHRHHRRRNDRWPRRILVEELGRSPPHAGKSGEDASVVSDRAVGLHARGSARRDTAELADVSPGAAAMPRRADRRREDLPPHNSHNTDGIDPSGWNIYIPRCTIDCGDDVIVFKPDYAGPNGEPAVETRSSRTSSRCTATASASAAKRAAGCATSSSATAPSTAPPPASA